MTYGKGAVPGISGVALLPFTGSNELLLPVAAALIALGVIVLVISAVLARKNRRASEI